MVNAQNRLTFCDESSQCSGHLHHDGCCTCWINSTEYPRVSVVTKQHIAICSSSSSSARDRPITTDEIL